MIPQFGKTARVLYKDTDALFYEIKTQDVYRDSLELKENMDFSSYPTNHFLYDEVNQKVPLNSHTS